MIHDIPLFVLVARNFRAKFHIYHSNYCGLCFLFLVMALTSYF